MFSSKVMSILALVAVIFFIALIVLQFLELSYFSAAPSVWPVTG